MRWRVLLDRVVLWSALLGVALGLACMVYLIVESLGPEPGANMVLMGMPCVALPTLLTAILVVSITWTGADGLRNWERQMGKYVGWPAIVLTGVLATLG